MGSFRDPSPVTVIVVDDSDLVCTVIQKLLSVDADIVVVHCASSAENAREYLATNPVDVITLDLNLPDASGPGLVDEMTVACRAAVIAVSASPEQCRLACERGALAAFDKLKLYNERFAFIAAIHSAADHSRAHRFQSQFPGTAAAVTAPLRQIGIASGQSESSMLGKFTCG